MLLGWRQGGAGHGEADAEGKVQISSCVSPWQLEKGIARHIQELSSSSDTQKPEDVSIWSSPFWTIFFGQPWIVFAGLVEASVTLHHCSLPTPGAQDTPVMGLRPPRASLDAHVSSRTGPGTACPCSVGRSPSGILPGLLCPAGHGPPALPNTLLLSLQSIIPLMKFLESELQYLNEHLVQENFKR